MRKFLTRLPVKKGEKKRCVQLAGSLIKKGGDEKKPEKKKKMDKGGNCKKIQT